MEFFNKISEKASTAYKVTAAKTGKLAKEAKLKLKMSNLKSQINDIYLDIGAKIYEKHLLKEDINIKNNYDIGGNIIWKKEIYFYMKKINLKK